MSEALPVPTLGRILPIDLREVWASEPHSFTPWLAQSDNLGFLAESLGLPGLELVATEQQVDIFSTDIVARAADTGETVLIENQIERSDHTHLGQIMTYAAGLEAAIVIWIARRFTDGHRAAIDWLNRITADDFAFFAVEVEALRIGDSLPAPRFNVVSKPNDWARSLRGVSHRSEAQQATDVGYQAFWDGYQTVAKSIGAPIRQAAQQVRSTNYYAPTSIRGTYFSAWKASKSVGVYFSMFGDDAERIFRVLETRRSEIEAAFGTRLEWQVRKEGAVYWVFAGQLPASREQTDWERQHAWIADMMKRLSDAIGPELAAIPAP